MRKIFLLGICLLGLMMISCETGSKSNSNKLAGTEWQGKSLETKVYVEFSKKECTISLSGYCEGTATASYSASKSNVTIVITSFSGSFDGQLEEGEKIKATYDLDKGKMIVTKEIYGEIHEIELTLVDGNNENTGNNNSPVPTVDFSGDYICSFTIPASPSYSVTQVISLQKDGSGYNVIGDTPFENSGLAYVIDSDYQFRMPQTEFVKNGKTYYITMTVMLTYNNGTFIIGYRNAGYGEKGVSGKIYEGFNFSLIKN